MAKGKNEFDIDFGDLGDDLDFDFGGDSKPLTRIEKKQRIRKGFLSGAMKALTSRDGIANILSRAIPSEYGLDPKLAVSVIQDLEDVYESAQREGSKVAQELKRSIAESESDLAKILPPKYAKALKEYADTREVPRGSMRYNPEEDEVQRHMAGLFDRQEANETLREDRENKREILTQRIEQHRHGESIESLGNLDRSINRLVSFNESIAAPFYRKSIEIGVRQYFVQAKQLEVLTDLARVSQDNMLALHKAISKPEVIKLAEHEETRQRYGGSTGARSVFGSGSGIVDRLRANSRKRMNELIQSGGSAAAMLIGANPLSAMGGMLSEKEMYEGFGGMLGQGAVGIASTIAGRSISNRLRQSRFGQKWGNKSRFTTSNARRLLEEQFLKGERDQWNLNEDGSKPWNMRHKGIKLIRDLLGDERGSRAIDTDNINNLQEPHPFTRQTNRTINEVIPGLLSMIHKELVHTRTGKAPQGVAFDYKEGKFTSAKDKAGRAVASVMRAGDGDQVRDRVYDLVDQIDADKTLSPETRRLVALQLLNDNYDNRLADPTRLGDAATFGNLSEKEAAKVAGLFGSHFKGDVNNEKAIAFSESFNDLLTRSNINRDLVQGMMNTGDRAALERAGIVKDGAMDPRRIMELMLDTDYGAYSGSATFGAMDRQRAEAAEAEAKRLAQAKSMVGGFGAMRSIWEEEGIGGFTKRARGGFAAGADFVSGKLDQYGIPQKFNDLSDEAKAYLDEHGITERAGNLSAEAKELLKSSGITDFTNRTMGDLGDLGRKVSRKGRRMGIRGRRKARGMRERYAEGGLGAVREDIRTAAGNVSKNLNVAAAGAASRVGDGIKRVRATAENIEAQVTEYLETLDPSEITSSVIDQATRLAVTAKGELKSIDELRKDMSLEKMKGASRSSITEANAKLNNFKAGLKDRIANIRKTLRRKGDITAEDLVDGSDPEKEQTRDFAVVVTEAFNSSTEKLKSSIEQITAKLTENREEEKEEREEDKEEQNGPRKGSWADLMANAKGKTKSLVTSLTSKHQKGQGMGSLLGILSGAMKFVGGIPAMLMSAWGAIKAFGVGGAIGKLLLGPKASTIGKAAWTVGKWGVRGGIGLAKGAWAAAKLLPLLATPAGLAVLAGAAVVAGVGYGVYKGVQWLNRIKPTPLNQYRMVQYGIKLGDEKHLRKIAEFEEIMHKGVQFTGGRPRFDYNAIDWKSAFKLFELPESGEDPDGKISQFEHWVMNRFGPAYLVWASVTKNMTGKLDFEKPEDLKGEELVQFAEGIRFSGGQYPTDVTNPITLERVEYGSREVENQWTALKGWVDKESKRRKKGTLERVAGWFGFSDPREELAAKLAKKEGVKDVTAEGQTSDSEATKSEGGPNAAVSLLMHFIDPFGIGRKIVEGVQKIANFFVKSAPLDKVDDLARIKAFDALRFRMYGLKELDYTRVKNLLDLENEALEFIEYKSKGEVVFTGSVEALGKLMMGKFGISDQKGEAANAWIRWCNLRFLPVFVNAISVTFKLTKEKDFRKALSSMSRVHVIEAANFLIGTVTEGQDNKPGTVWGITDSPWPDMAVNTDPSSVDANLAFIREEAGKAILSEDAIRENKTVAAAEGDQTALMELSGVDQESAKRHMAQRNGGGGSTQVGGGNFNASMTPMSTSQGTGGNVNDIAKPTGSGYQAMRQMLNEVAQVTGVDPFVLSTMIGMESSFDPNAVEPSTKAAGLGQFLPKTWKQMLERYGSKYGLGKDTSALDPRANALMVAEYIKENMKGMSEYITDRPLSQLDVYMAHYMGVRGYKEFLSAGMDALGKDVRPNAAAKEGNKPIFYDKSGRPRTVREIMAEMQRRFLATGRDFGIENSGASASPSSSPDQEPMRVMEKPNGTSRASSESDILAHMSSTNLGVDSGDSILSPSSMSNSTLTPTESLSRSIIPGANPSSIGGSRVSGGAEIQEASNGMPIYPDAPNVKGMAGTVTISREASTQNGTFGIVTLPDGSKMHSLELPWKDNEPRVSCIPPGTYPCAIKNSPKFGTVYRVNDVPGRSEILFHAGNSAGDASRGLKADSLGCILLGYGRSRRGNQDIITDSRSAVKAFNEKLGGKPFTLVVTGGDGDAMLGDPLARNQNADSTITEGVTAPGGPSGFSNANPFDSLVPPSSSTPATGSGDSMDTYRAANDAGDRFGNYSPMSAGVSTPQASQEPSVAFETLNVQRSILSVLEQSLVVLKEIKGISTTGAPPTEAEKRADKANQRTEERMTGRSTPPKPMQPYTRTI